LSNFLLTLILIEFVFIWNCLNLLSNIMINSRRLRAWR
jgi:hypothetical protein